MKFALSEEQLALQEAVRRVLSRHSGSAAVRRTVSVADGFDREVWKLLSEQVGVGGLSIPEEYGGSGATLVETHVVLEELGRTLTPAPMLGSAVLAAHTLLAAGDAEACARLLPPIADGSSIAALAWSGPEGRWDPATAACTAEQGEPGWSVDGEAHYVLDGDIADVLLVVARAGETVGLFQVDPADPTVTRAQSPTMDLTRRLSTIKLSRAPGRRIGSGDVRDALIRARDVACVALSAEQVGAAARCLQMTVDYTRQREQFGRPIGSFQALKHRMADLHVQVETAWSLSYASAWMAAHDPARLPDHAAMVKTYCSEVFGQVTAEMIQLHGGIAITWEHDAHLYFKRAHGSAQLFGQPREHLRQLTESILPARGSASR